MTDVRLTALNPEDSQVYPVACNSSGELLVDKGETVEYVKVAGDNMTGELTLGTDPAAPKITLNENGSSTFEGRMGVVNASAGPALDIKEGAVFVGSLGTDGTDFKIQTIPNSTGRTVFTTKASSVTYDRMMLENSGNLLVGGTLPSAPNIELNSSGTATFADNVSVDHYLTVTNKKFSNNARVQIQGDNDVAISVYPNSSSVSRTIELRHDGRATFSGDVVVSSRGKKWMLVEQGGLCHMVQQVRASTPDAEYPKLRDVFAELNVIEKALEEVMEKLRMTAPNGWPVWDGSDNS